MLYLTRPVWTGFKIVVRRKLLMHNKTELQTGFKKVIVNIMIYYESKLYTAYKKGNC